MRTFLTPILFGLLALVAEGQAQTLFPVPKDASGVRHVVQVPGEWEQDSFVVTRAFPDTSAIAQLGLGPSECIACEEASPGWQSFGDSSGTAPVFRHQFIKRWFNKSNDSAVVVALLYNSAGLQRRSTPDSENQEVFVIRYRVTDARAFLKEAGAACG